MDSISFDGKWTVREAPLDWTGLDGLAKAEASTGNTLPAIVPGEVHLDLMRAGKMDEPLVSLNAPRSRWPEQRSWWYVKEFSVTAPFLAHERQQLVFEGLDLHAQVFLNGEWVGESRNAFVPAVFDVRHRLRNGKNRAVVRLTAGDELVEDSLKPKTPEKDTPYSGRMAFPGITHLRKPQFSYGWDWVDALPNIGIWRGVRLEGHSGLTLHELRADTRIDGDNVLLDVLAVVENLHPWAERAGVLEIAVAPPKGKTIKRRIDLAAQVGRSPLHMTIPIPAPQLWWPNGMGGQPLYRVTASVAHAGAEHDRREIDIGLRTIDIVRTPLKEGSRFCICVNGEDVFCRGGNWIPADAILARVDKKRYEALIAEAANANFNMLRVWGGGIYESEDFYNACDRAGILVWQDFMFACAQYPDYTPAFRAAVRDEAEAAVRRLRHHPCIALWSGNNENIWGFSEWWNYGKTIDDISLQVGGRRIYNEVLPDVCRALDPSRPYWPSSPCGGDMPNGELAGDCHWWPQFTMSQDMERRIHHEVFDECRSRFVSEYGVIGPCHLDSVREFLKPDEIHVDSPAWREHTNTFEKATMPAAITHHYADADTITVEEYTLYGQMFQALMYGRSIDALRFRKHDPVDDCQGALIWMFNDCWGETGWTPIDYYLRRKASYYWIRSACAPVRAIVRRRKNMLVTRVVNDTLAPVDVEAHFGWMRVDGSDAEMESQRIPVEPNTMMEVAKDRVPAESRRDPREWIYAAYLAGDGIELAPSIWTFRAHRELATVDPHIEVNVKGRDITVTSDVYCHGVHADDGGRAVYSDNYFDLLPGVPKKIRVVAEKMPKRAVFRAIGGQGTKGI